MNGPHRRRSVFAVCGGAALAFVGGVGAQEPTGYGGQRDGPRSEAAVAGGFDALVLSTGSSRGLAHAGALLGLERRGYDPELIAGSSMGAVIGALYAAGYSAREIWTLILGTSWGELFGASPVMAGPERQLLFPGVTLGLDLGTLEVSSGFIPDWRVNRFLTHLLFDANARARSDFDRLPRRYRSVTTDLATGEEVVLAEGDLARAVRASMGTPAFFAAVRWNGRLLSDGGIANYLPVSVARQLGAGRVVAVDVSRALPEVRRTDPTSLASRSISLLMRNALRDTVPPDVLLRPEVDPDLPSAVFPDNATELLGVGLRAALDAELAPSEATPPRRPPPPPATLADLVIETDDAALSVYARNVFRNALGAYRPAVVLRATDRAYATGLFRGVWPRVERRTSDSVDVLVVSLDARPRGALNASAGYDNDRGGRAWVVLDWRLAAFDSPLEARVGGGNDGIERWYEASLLLHSARLPGLGWSAGLHHRQVNAPFWGGGADDPETQHTGGWAGVRVRFGDAIASVAGQLERLDVEEVPSGRSWGGMVRLSSALPPTQIVGAPSELLARARAGVFRYQALSARTSLSGRVGPLHSAAVFEGAATFGAVPPDELPALGDRRGMPGLRWGQERGRGRVLAGVDAAHPVMSSGWVRLRARVGAAPDDAEELTAPDRWVAGAALEALWTTPFGPVLVGWGINTMGLHRFDISIGGGP